MDAGNPLVACPDGKDPLSIPWALAASEPSREAGHPVFDDIEAGSYAEIVFNRHRRTIARVWLPPEDGACLPGRRATAEKIAGEKNLVAGVAPNSPIARPDAQSRNLA
jgi:hypothetical protein